MPGHLRAEISLWPDIVALSSSEVLMDGFGAVVLRMPLVDSEGKRPRRVRSYI